jgi:hypothetical protein
MAMEATGKLRAIFETKQFSERFSKREFVLELVDGKYPQTVLFQVTGDRCASLDQFQIGDEVRLEFNLRGREWKSPQGDTKYFNSLDVWRIEPARAARSRRSSAAPDEFEVPRSDEPRPADVEDLPF